MIVFALGFEDMSRPLEILLVGGGGVGGGTTIPVSNPGCKFQTSYWLQVTSCKHVFSYITLLHLPVVNMCYMLYQNVNARIRDVEKKIKQKRWHKGECEKASRGEETIG